MRNLLVLSFLLSGAIHGQTPMGKAKVLVIDQDIDTTQLEKKYDVEKAAPSNLSIPDLESRNKLFEGIIFPENWDDLKKDVFFMELRSKSINDLIKKYPELKKSDIKKLKGKS